jgi:cell division protein FtsI/penicillin-binding protein 2
MKGFSKYKTMLAIMAMLLLVVSSYGATVSSHHVTKSKSQITEKPGTKKKLASTRHSRPLAKKSAGTRGRRVRHRYYERFTASSFAENQTLGDLTTGEDQLVRQAAIDALGGMNGTVVAIDPNSGRVLAMVNQKLALSEGAQPCSTIKISVALAALSEGVVTKDTKVNLGGWRMDMNQALAHSNNQYFEALGRKLGFEKVSYYAHQFGLGELAGWNIDGEHLGEYPAEVIPEKLGGVGKMCSFGEGISMTPLQLGALVSAIANGGTLYYLQHPTSQDEVANYQPKVKRYLDIAPLIPEVSVGMLGATQFGTARSLRASFVQEDVLGKTGTCSKDGTRFGWFASYANTQYGRIVTVFFLEGGRPTFGPKAAELAGKFYRSLYEGNYFAARPATTTMRTQGSANPVGATQ